MNRHARAVAGLAAAFAVSLACAPQEQAPPPPPTPEPTPARLTVARSALLNAAPADVWAVVGDFGAVHDFIEVVESVDVEGEGVGAVRTLNLADGAKVIETLRAYDAEAMTLSYTIDESPLPIRGYQATMKVTAAGEGASQFDWSSTFDAEGAPAADAQKSVADVYDMGVAGLKALFPDEVQ